MTDHSGGGLFKTLMNVNQHGPIRLSKMPVAPLSFFREVSLTELEGCAIEVTEKHLGGSIHSVKNRIDR